MFMTHLNNVAELMAALASRMMVEPAWLACFKAARPVCVGDSAETAMKALMDKVTKERVLPQHVCRQIADMFVFGKEVTFSMFVVQYLTSCQTVVICKACHIQKCCIAVL